MQIHQFIKLAYYCLLIVAHEIYKELQVLYQLNNERIDFINLLVLLFYCDQHPVYQKMS